MRIILCDRDFKYLQNTKERILSWAKESDCLPAVSIETFSSSEYLLEYTDFSETADLLFIDTCFPGEISGPELADIIRRTNSRMMIVFVTDRPEYAAEGYRLSLFRYLIKPVETEPLTECLNSAYRFWKYKQNSSPFLIIHKPYTAIPYSDITYIEVRLHAVEIHMIDGERIPLRFPLCRLLEMLPGQSFARCGKSFIINMRYIQSVRDEKVLMNDGTLIPIGKAYKSALLAGLRAYTGREELH